MAKNTTNPYVGKATTPAGIMPPDMVKRHKLTMNTPSADPTCRRAYHNNRHAKKMFELMKSYRLLAHGVNENRLAQPLRDAVHFLLTPLGREGGGKGNYTVSATRNSESDDTLAAVRTPMKV
jgi:hypothetical protein